MSYRSLRNITAALLVSAAAATAVLAPTNASAHGFGGGGFGGGHGFGGFGGGHFGGGFGGSHWGGWGHHYGFGWGNWVRYHGCSHFYNGFGELIESCY